MKVKDTISSLIYDTLCVNMLIVGMLRRVCCGIGVFAMVCCFMFASQQQLLAQQIEPNRAAALTVKVAAMEKSLCESGEGLVIYVIDAPDVARELRKVIGTSIGKSKLFAVQEGNSIPSFKPDILFVGSSDNVSKVIRYARQNHILTVSHRQEVFDAGISIFLGKEEGGGKSFLALNISASKEEALEWNPALLKIARSSR